MPSKYICMRCGSPISYWVHGWKHDNGGNSDTRSCGKPPHVVEREKYEKEMQEIVDIVVSRKGEAR